MSETSLNGSPYLGLINTLGHKKSFDTDKTICFKNIFTNHYMMDYFIHYFHCTQLSGQVN